MAIQSIFIRYCPGLRWTTAEEELTDKLLLKPTEAAEALGVSRARAYELIASKVIPSIKLGSTIRVPADALRAWIHQQIAERAGDGSAS